MCLDSLHIRGHESEDVFVITDCFEDAPLPSLIGFMVSVDVKHHVYLCTFGRVYIYLSPYVSTTNSPPNSVSVLNSDDTEKIVKLDKNS